MNFVEEMTRPNMKDRVMKTIAEQADLISALEAVGAMYNIPSTNIITDNTLDRIKVVGDNIVAPDRPNPSANAKAIMCSIGSALDNISQRIDDKINDFQANNVDVAKLKLKNNFSSPSKGEVVATAVDPNGEEVVLYKNGTYDCAETVSAEETVERLMKENGITPKGYQYFTDEEDLTASLGSLDLSAGQPTETNISSSIQESADMIDLISHFGDTRTLGYDLLQEQGFTYVQPTTEIIQEAATRKKNKIISPDDIKYFRFDNSNILKAIKYMNDARAEQEGITRGNLDLEKFANSENYKKAISCLCQQFDAKIAVRLFESRGSNLYTIIYNDIKNNLTLSKSKGFQLNGLPIDIHVIGASIDADAPTDISLFGQHVVSVFLHEIFHNIASVLRYKTAQQNMLLSSTVCLAKGIRDVKRKRIFLTNYANTLENLCGIKMNKIKRRGLVKYLMVVCSIDSDATLKGFTNKIENSASQEEADKYVQELIEYYTAHINKIKKKRSSKSIIAPVIATAVSAAGAIILRTICNKTFSVAADLGSIIFSGATGFAAINCLTQVITVTFLKSLSESYKNVSVKEEYFCDLFAGMYKLPVTFFIPDKRFNRGAAITPNQVSLDKMTQLAKLEKEIGQLTFSSYPSLSERNFAAVTIAKQMLEGDDKLDPAIQKYLQWIVDNYSSALDTEIREIYNTATFDPESAEDLDNHLNKLIADNNITLTEYFQ